MCCRWWSRCWWLSFILFLSLRGFLLSWWIFWCWRFNTILPIFSHSRWLWRFGCLQNRLSFLSLNFGLYFEFIIFYYCSPCTYFSLRNIFYIYRHVLLLILVATIFIFLNYNDTIVLNRLFLRICLWINNSIAWLRGYFWILNKSIYWIKHYERIIKIVNWRNWNL